MTKNAISQVESDVKGSVLDNRFMYLSHHFISVHLSDHGLQLLYWPSLLSMGQYSKLGYYDWANIKLCDQLQY